VPGLYNKKTEEEEMIEPIAKVRHPLSKCPRCRAPGMLVYPGPVYSYECGFEIDAVTGAYTQNPTCVHKPVPMTWAAGYGYDLQTFFAESLIGKDLADLPGIYRTMDMKTLYWPLDKLQTVLSQAPNFIGTKAHYTEYMCHVWVIDPDIMMLNGARLMSRLLFATDLALAAVDLMVPITPPDSDTAKTEYLEPYIWGTEITNIEHAELVAVYTWLQQPYVYLAEGLQHSRQVKRQAERKKQTLPSLQVIEFRRPEGYKPSNHRVTDRKLTVCFERVGFTRRQPCGPRNSERKTIWVPPTFVGDPALPFKPKVPKIWKATR
jgi:hypothetical protein